MLDLERLTELLRNASRRLRGPSLIFASILTGKDLLALIQRPGVLDCLVAMRAGVAIGLGELDAETAAAARLLNEHEIPLVAWLLLPPEAGFALGLRNYPQAAAYYRSFQQWSQHEQLSFSAVGLEIAASPGVARLVETTPRHFFHRLWLGRENALYAPARTALIELFTTIRHDGYSIHTYQLPIIADDRRVGTTLLQRALDIVDLPSDLDVLMCPSSIPLRWIGYDMGGSLIASYGPSADAIGIEGIGYEHDDDGEYALPWQAIERDLLLAAEYTDTIYVESLEDCVERQFLERIAAVPWGKRGHASLWRLLVVHGVRSFIFAVLVVTRFGMQAFAWLGWLLALVIWWRSRRGGYGS